MFAAGAVHFQDLRRADRLAHQGAHVADGADVDLAARQERVGAADRSTVKPPLTRPTDLCR